MVPAAEKLVAVAVAGRRVVAAAVAWSMMVAVAASCEAWVVEAVREEPTVADVASGAVRAGVLRQARRRRSRTGDG